MTNSDTLSNGTVRVTLVPRGIQGHFWGTAEIVDTSAIGKVCPPLHHALGEYVNVTEDLQTWVIVPPGATVQYSVRIAVGGGAGLPVNIRIDKPKPIPP